VLVKGLWGPFSFVADEGVGKDEKPSHHGDEGDLGGSSRFDEGLVLGFSGGSNRIALRAAI
jgi:hypothetical protein